MNLLRVTSTVGAAAVAAIAGWSSYSHMVHVALAFGERPEVAYALPISVDGMLVVASAAMVDDKRNSRTPRMSARVAFAIGVTASVAANVAAAAPSVGARLVAGWPALALLLVVELLARRGKTTEKSAQAATVSTEATSRPASRVRRARSRRARRPVAESRQMLRELLADDPATPVDSLARSLGVSPRRVKQILTTT